ncbi:MAG: class I SAM-dependent methyltransferase [Phycisphaerae bacterium]
MRYSRWLPETGGVMLDWGCNHAPDACMLEADHRSGYAAAGPWTYFGCDFGQVHTRPGCDVFHRFAGLEYTPVRHPGEIPFDDGKFDVVITSGVLEHVANDAVALGELYRVLKVGGQLVLTFLPNRWSLSENLCRMIGLTHHRRLYRPGQIRRMLLHSGFEVFYTGFHQFIPAHRLQKVLGPLHRLNGVLERTWPLRSFSTSILIAGRKRLVM